MPAKSPGQKCKVSMLRAIAADSIILDIVWYKYRYKRKAKYRGREVADGIMRIAPLLCTHTHTKV